VGAFRQCMEWSWLILQIRSKPELGLRFVSLRNYVLPRLHNPARPAQRPAGARPKRRLLDADDGLRLSPVALELVVVAFLLGEYVDDHCPEVQQRPV
jgi:hypothetical protein